MLRDSAAGRRADENVFLPIVTLLNRWEFYSWVFFFLPLCCARLSFMTPWYAGIGFWIATSAVLSFGLLPGLCSMPCGVLVSIGTAEAGRVKWYLFVQKLSR